MRKIVIERLTVHGDDGMDHCWAPIVNGKVAQHVGPDGRTEPCRSVRGAKRAAARELSVDESELEFDVRR